MGRLLVHMHHGGYNCFSGLVLLKEAERFLKILPDFRQLLALEELRVAVNIASTTRTLSVRVRQPTAWS